jgi:hypothetical protein
MVLGPDPLRRHVAYEEPHIPLFAAPAFQNVSRRGHYGDAVQQMDSSVGTCAVLHVLQSAVAFWGGSPHCVRVRSNYRKVEIHWSGHQHVSAALRRRRVGCVHQLCMSPGVCVCVRYVIFTSDNGAWIHPGTGLTAVRNATCTG